MRYRLPISRYAVLMALTLVACEQADQALQIAVIADTSGPSASFGNQLKHAANYVNNMAQYRHLNLKATFVDDKGDIAEATIKALESIADPTVVAVVGHATSATTRAGQALYLSYDMPLVAPIATYSALTTSPRNTIADNVVRMVPSNSRQATLIGDFLDH